MPQKSTLHAYFAKKTTVTPMRNVTNIGECTPENASAPGGQICTKAARASPASASAEASNKRKATAAPNAEGHLLKAAKQPRIPGNEGSDRRKAKMQELLGEGSAKEQNLKAVQERFSWLDSKNVKDAAGKRPNDKDYDSRTVLIPSGVWQSLSASQKQYWEVKKKYRDVVLFFKVGSFYELYEEDALIGQDVLGWKLTLTGVGACRQVGCPASGIDDAAERLLAAGYKVGRMEQIETSAEAKAKRGPKATVRRELTRVLTPATAADSVSADSVTLMALAETEAAQENAKSRFGFAFLDAAAARFYVGSIADDAGRANLCAVLTQIAPREVVVPRNCLSAATSRRLVAPPMPLQLTTTDPADFTAGDVAGSTDGSQASLPAASQQEKELFGDLHISKAVAATGEEAMAALAALVKHLRRLKLTSELATEEHTVAPFGLYEGALRMDGPTLQNLEILATQDGGRRGSLLERLDSCHSQGGRRLLRRWICRPLRSIAAIEARFDAVRELAAAPAAAGEIAGQLRRVPDLERLLGRVRNAGSAPSPGAPAWAITAAQSKRLTALLGAAEGMKQGVSALSTLETVLQRERMQSAILQDALSALPPPPLLLALDQTLQSLTVSKAAKGKQGSAELKADVVEAEMRNSSWPEEDAKVAAEIAVTDKLLASFSAHFDGWEALEAALSAVDVLCAFAAFAACAEGPTCRPTLVREAADGGPVLDVKALWHPCAMPGTGNSVVPNDLQLSSRQGGARALLLTGPNMGGKSTLLRAACVAQIMAQAGCWVPAAAATLSLADRIFTRLGAADRIVAGESTFLVECNEAATILREATPSSLVVLDELGRGTGTFDGYAIAEAVLSYLSRVGCRLLFATHYHALTATFQGVPNVRLGHMAAIVGGGPGHLPGITFLYRLHEGSCPESHGLQVAQLAGIPQTVLLLAQEKGQQLENKLKAAFFGREGLDDAEVGALKEAVKSCVWSRKLDHTS